MNTEKWIKENTSDLTNKTIALTGSTGGLGYFLVKTLARLNANLILINRNKEKTETQIKELHNINPKIKIEFIECDLSNFESVKIATETLKQKKIDVLYLSAGIYNVKRYKTDKGYDNIFQTNFVSHYYMAKQLLNNIKTANGKIVAVSSIAYNYSKIDTNDIDFSKQKKHSKVYGNAKRFLMFSLMKLCEKENVNLSVVHPGVTLTGMTNHYHKSINWLVKVFIKTFFPNTQQASLSLIKGLFENTNNLEWIGPKIFNVWGKTKKLKLKTCKENEIGEIFKFAEETYNNLTKQN